MTQRNPIMTTRTQILAVTAIALIVGYILGYYFGGGVHTGQHQVLTSRELTCLSTYAATLQMLEENQPSQASHLLEDRLRASVTALRDLTTRPVQVESPEFVQGCDKPKCMHVGTISTQLSGKSRRSRSTSAFSFEAALLHAGRAAKENRFDASGGSVFRNLLDAAK